MEHRILYRPSTHARSFPSSIVNPRWAVLRSESKPRRSKSPEELGFVRHCGGIRGGRGKGLSHFLPSGLPPATPMSRPLGSLPCGAPPPPGEGGIAFGLPWLFQHAFRRAFPRSTQPKEALRPASAQPGHSSKAE